MVDISNLIVVLGVLDLWLFGNIIVNGNGYSVNIGWVGFYIWNNIVISGMMYMVIFMNFVLLIGFFGNDVGLIGLFIGGDGVGGVLNWIFNVSNIMVLSGISYINISWWFVSV